jgi:hypothetical protein
LPRTRCCLEHRRRRAAAIDRDDDDDAATNFLASLSPEQRQQATFAFDSAERLRWHFVPQFERNGLQIKAMSEPQRKLAHELLKTGLSARGYDTYTKIMQLENILRDVEKAAARRVIPRAIASRCSAPHRPRAPGAGASNSIMSRCTSRWERHRDLEHPSFAGANPAEVKDGPQKGQRTLGALEDTARALVTSLDAGQRKTAIFDAVALNDIVTGNALDIKPLAPQGLMVSTMNPSQRDQLMKILDAYAGFDDGRYRRRSHGQVKAAGIEKIGFAWAGSTERGQKHYYRVQGPTFLIEFDNSQNDGNHVHSIWRDFNGGLRA